MEENFYDNDFEKFLQQQVRHHRMYPSDAVWKGIHKQMHGHKKWPGLYFLAILLVASLTVCTLLLESGDISAPKTATARATALKFDELYPEQITEHTIRNISPSTVTGNDLQIDASSLTASSIASTINNTVTSVSSNIVGDSEIPSATSVQRNTADENMSTASAEQSIITNNDNTIASTAVTTNKSVTTTTINSDTAKEAVSAKEAKSPTDNYLEEHADEAERIAAQKLRSKPSKWELQFYIAPSSNHRDIVDQKSGEMQSGGPVASNYGVNAGKVIRYSPGMGIEFGIGTLYNLNSRVKIKAGLQYNIRQYNIDAYAGSTELAKIALVRGGNVDTILALSSFRSNGSNGEAQLLNKYHQVSLPIGIEYTLFNSKRFGFNIGGTLQPTYTFSESSYLLSSDYKSYADGKSIIRRWNVNSSLEASFTYKARNIQWKFGPQLRYQHLPNYTDAYPIKEYLIDYGFKIGFTKPIR